MHKRDSRFTGAAAEAIFAAGALSKGWTTYVPIVDCGHDFVVDRGCGYERVQVKAAKQGGEVRLRRIRDRVVIEYDDDFDLLCIVVSTKAFLLEREDWEGKKSISRAEWHYRHRVL